MSSAASPGGSPATSPARTLGASPAGMQATDSQENKGDSRPVWVISQVVDSLLGLGRWALGRQKMAPAVRKHRSSLRAVAAFQQADPRAASPQSPLARVSGAVAGAVAGAASRISPAPLSKREGSISVKTVASTHLPFTAARRRLRKKKEAAGRDPSKWRAVSGAVALSYLSPSRTGWDGQEQTGELQEGIYESRPARPPSRV